MAATLGDIYDSTLCDLLLVFWRVKYGKSFLLEDQMIGSD
jgi:hypothetical protein